MATMENLVGSLFSQPERETHVRRLQALDDLRTSADGTTLTMNEDSAVIRLNETMRLAHVLSIYPSILLGPTLVVGLTGISLEVGGFLAVKHFNERSGEIVSDLPELLEGCDIRLTWKPLNSEARPLTAVTKLLENAPHNPSLQNPYPMAVLGAAYSYPSTSLAIFGGVHNIPQCSCCSLSRDLDSREDHPYFTRTQATGEAEAKAAAAYFHALGVTHVAVLHVGDLYAQLFAKDFKDAMETLGHPNMLDVEYVLSDSESISAAMERIKTSGLRYIFAIVFVQDVAIVADLASRAGIMGPDHVWILANGAQSITALQGVVLPDQSLRALHGVGATIFGTPSNPQYNAALQSFQQDEELQQYYINKQENPGFFETFDMSTLIAPHWSLLNYDAAITLGLAACRAKSDLFSASELYESILTTEFEGATGHVSFNNETGTRSLQGIRYKVQNVLASKGSDGTANFTTVVTANIYFDTPNVVDFIEPFVYNDNTTTPPLSLPPLVKDPNLIGQGARITGLVLCAIITLMSIGWAVWTYINKKHRQVRAAQPFFLFMICIGTFIMASAIIPTSFQEPMSDGALDAGCMMFPWLFFLGFVTVFSALFTKVRRIYTLYRLSIAFRRIKIRPIDALKPFAALLLINIVLLVTWTVISPWKWERVDGVGVDQFGRPTDSYGRCESDNQTVAMTFGILLVVLNFIPVVLANYQTYRARSLPTQYNESKYIAYSMAILLEAALIGLPIIIMAKDDPTALFVAQSVIIFIVCLAVLLFMFVPKWLDKDKPALEIRHISSTQFPSSLTLNEGRPRSLRSIPTGRNSPSADRRHSI